MKRLLLVLGFMIQSLLFYGQEGAVFMQDKAFIDHQPIDSGLLRTISKQKEFTSLSVFDQGLIYWLNILHQDPPTFSRNYLTPFLRQFPELQGKDARSLEKDLLATEPLSSLITNKNLKQAAELQANYLAKSNLFTHTGPRGKSFTQRMSDAGIKGCAAENLFAGKADPLIALFLLLIDNGVEGAGHRKILLSPAFAKIGIGKSTGTKLISDRKSVV